MNNKTLFIWEGRLIFTNDALSEEGSIKHLPTTHSSIYDRYESECPFCKIAYKIENADPERSHPLVFREYANQWFVKKSGFSRDENPEIKRAKV